MRKNVLFIQCRGATDFEFYEYFFFKDIQYWIADRTELFLARRPSLLETGQNDELLASAMVSKDYHKGYFFFYLILL